MLGFLVYKIYKQLKKIHTMVSNIVVFQTPKTTEYVINKTEQEIMYDRFRKDKNLNVFHFDSFLEMEIAIDAIKKINTNIPSISIKALLKYCVPIISEIPHFTVKKKTVDIFMKEKPTTKSEIYYNISIQHDKPLHCIVENKSPTYPKYVVIPTNIPVSIIGLIIPKKLIPIIDGSMPDFVQSLKPHDLLNSGKFGLMEFQSGVYTQSRINELLPKDGDQTPIYFTSDADSLIKIENIRRYIRYINGFYENNHRMLHTYMLRKPFLHIINNHIKLYKTMYPKYDKNFYSTTNPKIQAMEQIMHVKLCDIQYNNNFTFDALGVTDVYNKLNMLGKNHPQIKKIFQVVDLERDSRNIIAEYQKIKFKKMLEFSKRKSIALNKFNTVKLKLLTPAQNKIIDLEFKKMELII